tara:strand:- start:843 stop:1493 length:651 start_codon:yes stop_codon:yes gene_type:complete
MQNMKHVGRVANTGLKCVVVFREMYDARGNVEDPNHCLIVETERLPDMEHDDMVRVVESGEAQQNADFFHVAQRNKFSDGTNMLARLSQKGYLKKYPTDQIELTPNSSTAIKLSQVNEVIKKQATGMSNKDIANAMVDDTDSPPRNHSNLSESQTINEAVDTNEQVLDDSALAQQMLDQATTYEAEVKRLREEAYSMAPDLKPKRGRPKATANANT